MNSGIFAEPILVGRKQELTELKHHLRLVTEGTGTTIFISGKAGTGKSRLANEFLNYAKKEREITTLTGWCLRNAAIPYFPFIEAFNAYFTTRKGEKKVAKQTEKEESEIKSWLIGLKQAEKSGKPDNLSPQAWRDLTFAAVTKALISISTKKPTILFIDDLHWADSASIALLHYISRSIVTQKIMVLATYRSEELSPRVEGQPPALIEALRLMRREDLFKEIKLANLSPSDVSRIAGDIVGGTIAPDFAEKLAEESQGNPLFIIESLRMLSERGSLVQESGQWELSVDKLSIPTKIRDIILQRLSVLKPSQRRVLDLASVIGEKFNVKLLGEVLGQDSLEILEILDAVARSSSLVVCEGNFYKFDHEKSREALYEEISPPLKRGYHARIAEKIEAASLDDKEISLSDLAYHYAQAGNLEKSVRYSISAGRDAIARFSNPEAIKHFKYVLKTIDNLEEYSAEKKVALEGLGDAYYANCMFEEAIKTFEKLANSERGAARLRAYRKEMDALWFMEYDATRLIQLVKQTEKFVTSDRLEKARVLWFKGAVLFRLGDNLDESLRYHEKALQIFKEEYSLPDIAKLLDVTGVTRVMAGSNPEKGLGELQRSIALYHELGDTRGEISAALHRNNCFGILKIIEDLPNAYSKLLEMAEKVGDFETVAFACMQTTYWLESMGFIQKAITRSLKALKFSQKTDTRRLQTEIFAALTRQYARIGDLKQANHYFRMLMETPPEIRLNQRTAPPAILAEAVVFAAKSLWKEAEQRFLKVIELSKMGIWRSVDFEGFARRYYIWALNLQGRTQEAKIKQEKNQKTLEKARKRFDHANLQADLMIRRKANIGEDVEMRLDIVNVGKGKSTITKIEGINPAEWIRVTISPSDGRLQNNNLDIEPIEIGAFQVHTIKLNVQAIKTGAFSFNPHLTYIDDLGETRTCRLNPVEITVQKAQPTYKVLPGRITTGFPVLDSLLFGGIPENYAVVLTGPPSDERAALINNFLEAGTKNDEIVFYVTTEAENLQNLLKNPNFHLFLCNPKPKTKITNLQNVSKLRSKTDLTNLNISLLKAYRDIDPSKKKRICIETVSNILLNYEAKATCNWISELTTDLSSKGFTILAVIDPSMHPPDQANAVINSFDGEISITQTGDPLECKKSLRVRRLRNQDYIKNPICLTNSTKS